MNTRPKDAKATMVDSKKAQDSIVDVVHDYTILLWCRQAVQQPDSIFPPVVRSHLAFAYFLPYRAFADFFSEKKRYVPKDFTTADLDVRAVDYSDQPSYERTEWKAWLTYMDTHLFHLNYYRRRATRAFDSHAVISAIHPEFETNWKNFIAGLRGNFPALFKDAIDQRRRDCPNLTLYP